MHASEHERDKGCNNLKPSIHLNGICTLLLTTQGHKNLPYTQLDYDPWIMIYGVQNCLLGLSASHQVNLGICELSVRGSLSLGCSVCKAYAILTLIHGSFK